jgi:hypothetical protein
MKQTTVIIHWRGPFYAVDELAGEFGLYFLTGKLKRQRNADIQLQKGNQNVQKNLLYLTECGS